MQIEKNLANYQWIWVDQPHWDLEFVDYERSVLSQFRELVQTQAPLLQDLGNRERFAPGHLTASAFIVDPIQAATLLIFHPKLKKWVQLGGHVESGEEVEDASRREAREESGRDELELSLWTDSLWTEDLPNSKLVPHPKRHTPLDLDVHEIPMRKDEAAHLHFDVRFLYFAPCREGLRREFEAEAGQGRLAWIALSDLPSFTSELSVLRQGVKATKILSSLQRLKQQPC